VRALEKEVEALKSKLASSQGDELLAQAVDVNGVQVLAAVLQGADAKALRETMDKLKDKLKTAAIVLAAVDGAKVQLAAGVTADRTARSRPVNWSTSWPSRWVARAAANPTWPWPAAPTLQACRRRWPAWRPGWRSAWTDCSEPISRCDRPRKGAARGPPFCFSELDQNS
jgi:hypothetical protein